MLLEMYDCINRVYFTQHIDILTLFCKFSQHKSRLSLMAQEGFIISNTQNHEHSLKNKAILVPSLQFTGQQRNTPQISFNNNNKKKKSTSMADEF